MNINTVCTCVHVRYLLRMYEKKDRVGNATETKAELESHTGVGPQDEFLSCLQMERK